MKVENIKYQDLAIQRNEDGVSLDAAFIAQATL